MKRSTKFFLLALLLVGLFVLANCNDNSDDDNQAKGDDDANLNGWSNQICSYLFGGAVDDSASQDNYGCIPPTPPDGYKYADDYWAILNAYLGDYQDENGNPRNISCSANNSYTEWKLGNSAPNVPCDPVWFVPLGVTADDSGERYEGVLCESMTLFTDGDISYTKQGDGIWAEEIEYATDENKARIIHFSNGDVWTKTE